MGWVTLAILILNGLAILAMIFWEQKSPSSTLIWVLTMTFLPVLGFVLYLFIGQGARFGRHKKFLAKVSEDEEYNKIYQKQVSSLKLLDVDKNVSSLVHFNLKSMKSLCVNHNEAEIFTDTKKLFDNILKDINEAKKTIHLEYFIFKPDNIGKKIRNALIKKAEEGVKVRLVYDDLGTLKTHKSFFKKLKKAGGEVARFFASKIRLVNLNINYRNHRKLIVIDNFIAYTGGVNIGDEYLGLHKRIKPWRDTHVRVVGEIATLINLRLLSDFSFAMKKDVIDESAIDMSVLKEKKVENILPMQFTISGPDTRNEEIKSAYLKAIYGAKKSIFLQTPYFIPDTSFVDALKTAALSGVNVELMIPKVPDKKFVYYSTISFAKQLLKFGIKVHLFKGFIHSKTLLVDDEISSIGTFNLDMRSFNLHFENTLFFYDKTFASQMKTIFKNDSKNSIRLTEEYIRKRPHIEKFLEKLSRLFTPLF